MIINSSGCLSNFRGWYVKKSGFNNSLAERPTESAYCGLDARWTAKIERSDKYWTTEEKLREESDENIK